MRGWEEGEEGVGGGRRGGEEERVRDGKEEKFSVRRSEKGDKGAGEEGKGTEGGEADPSVHPSIEATRSLLTVKTAVIITDSQNKN